MDPENQSNLTASENTVAQRPGLNYFAWLGPIVTFVGAISYFLYFARFADLRDFPWVNLPLVIFGVALSLLGLKRAFAGERKLLSKLFAIAGSLVSVGLGGLFCFYIFHLSSQLPGDEGVPKVGDVAPNFAMLDQSGESVSLEFLKGHKAVLVFYRGHW